VPAAAHDSKPSASTFLIKKLFTRAQCYVILLFLSLSFTRPRWKKMPHKNTPFDCGPKGLNVHLVTAFYISQS